MKQGQIIDTDKIGERQFTGANEFVQAIANHHIVWSWGAHDYAMVNEEVLRFSVQAHRHTGYVFVAVNGADLFNIYLTELDGTIKKVFFSIYNEDFINIIDTEIELIDAYKQ